MVCTLVVADSMRHTLLMHYLQYLPSKQTIIIINERIRTARARVRKKQNAVYSIVTIGNTSSNRVETMENTGNLKPFFFSSASLCSCVCHLYLHVCWEYGVQCACIILINCRLSLPCPHSFSHITLEYVLQRTKRERRKIETGNYNNYAEIYPSQQRQNKI